MINVIHVSIHWIFTFVYEKLNLILTSNMTPQESLQLSTAATDADIAAGEKVCPVCSREAQNEFVPLVALPEDLQNLIRANAPDTHHFQAVCARCVRLFERAKEHIFSDAAMNKDGSFVLSTPFD